MFANPTSIIQANRCRHNVLFPTRLPPQIAPRLAAPSELAASNGGSGFRSLLPPAIFLMRLLSNTVTQSSEEPSYTKSVLSAQVNVLYTFHLFSTEEDNRRMAGKR